MLGAVIGTGDIVLMKPVKTISLLEWTGGGQVGSRQGRSSGAGLEDPGNLGLLHSSKGASPQLGVGYSLPGFTDPNNKTATEQT